jgi:beta-galactosidase
MEDFGRFTGTRAQTFFGFDWQFALTDSRNFPEQETDWRPVQLPHDWSVDSPVEENAPSSGSGGYARTGIGWYRRSFTLESCEAEKTSLLFDGVYMNCDVWLNGVHVGGHIYGYTSFELDVTHALQSGINEVLVRVDNSHQPGSRWYSGSGITRDVWLLRTNATHIRTWGVFIKTDRVSPEQADAEVCVEAECAPDAGPLTLKVEITDPEGRICARECSLVTARPALTCRYRLKVPTPQLWDTETPRLYTAAVRILSEGKVLDETETPFGIRTIAYDSENGFLLNGRKVILRGVCLHHDGGCVGAAVPPEIWRRRLKKLKAMGCNALRCSHNPPDPALLDLADTFGFVVMDEAFDEWQLMKGKEFGSNTHSSRGYSDWFDACWIGDVTSMVLRDRNHPSIIMWSIGNEVREQVAEDGWKVARQLAGLCHALDATRPITQACDQVKAEPVAAYASFLTELDLVGVNYTDRWRERTETFFDEEKREHPDWLLLGTEDVSVGGVRGDYRLQTEESVWGRTTYYARMLKAEKLWKFIRTRPYVIGSFMWTGIDYLGESFWPAKGSDPASWTPALLKKTATTSTSRCGRRISPCCMSVRILIWMRSLAPWCPWWSIRTASRWSCWWTAAVGA